MELARVMSFIRVLTLILEIFLLILIFNFILFLSLSLSLSIHNRALKTTSPLNILQSRRIFNGEVCLVLSIEESRVGERECYCHLDSNPNGIKSVWKVFFYYFKRETCLKAQNNRKTRLPQRFNPLQLKLKHNSFRNEL